MGTGALEVLKGRLCGICQEEKEVDTLGCMDG